MTPRRHHLLLPVLGSTLLALAIQAPAHSAPAGPDAPGDFAKLHSVSATSPTDAWAVGFQQKPGGHSLGLIRHWDGSGWKTVPSVHPMDYSYVWGVEAISATDAWAVGETLGGAMILPFVEHWDGSHWQQVPLGGIGLGKLTAVSATGPDDVWMIGTRNDTSPFQYPRPLVVHWDGARLHVVHAAKPAGRGHSVELKSVTAVAPDDVWAVGSSGPHGQTYRPFLEHFDGTSWSVVSADSAQGSTTDTLGVDASSGTDAWSVGWYVQPGDPSISAYAQHWDGTSWTQSPVLTPGYSSYLTSVSVVAPDDVWAVGVVARALPQRTDRALIEHWDGTAWTIVSGPSGPRTAVDVESVSMTGPDAGFAVGEQTRSAMTTPYRIRWTGSAWTR